MLGQVLIPLLISNNHTITALSRSPNSDAKLVSWGAVPIRGDVLSLDVLRQSARETDATIHAAFGDFKGFEEYKNVCEQDREAISAMAEGMKGTGKIFIYTGGTLGNPRGRVLDEEMEKDESAGPRVHSEADTFLLAKRKGIHSIVIRLAPVVHGPGNTRSFVTILRDLAKEKGISGYVEGDYRWSAVHVNDCARLYLAALTRPPPPGSALHAVGEGPVAVKEIAQVIGEGLKLPVKAIPKEEVMGHFGFTGMVMQMDNPTTWRKTTEWTGWEPREIGLIEDTRAGGYF